MRSELFGSGTERAGTMVLQNPRMVRVELNGEMLARQGAMVAYQGQMDFAFEGGD